MGGIMKFLEDIKEYKSAREWLESLYSELGSDPEKAKSRRPERWAANIRKKEAAENIIMSMLGEHRPALARVGLEGLYEEFAAGGGDITTLYEIADATVKTFSTSKF